MDFERLAGSLLSSLHSIFGINLCPGDWAWTATAAGAVIGLIPMFGALAALVVRRISGNDYGLGAGLVFVVLGLGTWLALPWWLFEGVLAALDSGAAGRGGSGLGIEAESLRAPTCGILEQADYLVRSPTAADLVSGEASGLGWLSVLSAGIALVLALLCLLFQMMQAGSAFRTGPHWPRRVFWPAFVVLLVVTFIDLPATLLSHLLLGMLPATVVGSLVVRLFGISTAALNRSGDSAEDGHQRQSAQALAAEQQRHALEAAQREEQRRAAEREEQRRLAAEREEQQRKAAAEEARRAAAYQAAQQQQNPPPYQPPQHIPPYQPPPGYEPPPPRRDYPRTLLADQQSMAGAAGQSANLADTPGPLPFGLGGVAGAAAAGTTGNTPGGTQRTQSSSGGLPGNGRFQRIRQLGRGGFGTVWLAKDTQLDRTVAVKLAHAPDAETEERMLREARALAVVRHPNCVRVYDIVQDDDGLAIVMEYIEGRTLSDVVRESGALPDVQAARLWATMADALAAAHAKGVLHRDVKPSNIVVDEEGNAHLLDFGIARAKGDSSLTATGMMVGTPDYLAPEVARGEQATPASDSWQLAATVSYALTGHAPRGERENPIAALMAAARGEPCTQLPQHSAHHRLLVAALGPEPGRRPSLGAVRDELHGWLARAGERQNGPVTKMITRQTTKLGSGEAAVATGPSPAAGPTPGPKSGPAAAGPTVIAGQTGSTGQPGPAGQAGHSGPSGPIGEPGRQVDPQAADPTKRVPPSTPPAVPQRPNPTKKFDPRQPNPTRHYEPPQPPPTRQYEP